MNLTAVHHRLIAMARDERIILHKNRYHFLVQQGLRTDYLVMLPAQASALAELLEAEILLPARGEGHPVVVMERSTHG